MAWEQITPCDVNAMGTRNGYCLQNVRLAFGIPAKYYDAKEAMEANKAAGTLHDISTLPTDVAVPVFCDTYSPNEHVIIADHGVLYSDGKKLTTLTGMPAFGWGETLNDVRIVERVEDKIEPEAPAKMPAEDEIVEGDLVVPTRLVDYNGIPLKQYDDRYTVLQHVPGSDRVVLSARGQVWAALNIKDVKKVIVNGY